MNDQIFRFRLQKTYALIILVPFLALALLFLKSSFPIISYVYLGIFYIFFAAPIFIAKISIKDGHLQYRNIYGLHSKTVDLNNLSEFYLWQIVSHINPHTRIHIRDSEGHKIDFPLQGGLRRRYWTNSTELKSILNTAMQKNNLPYDDLANQIFNGVPMIKLPKVLNKKFGSPTIDHLVYVVVILIGAVGLIYMITRYSQMVLQ